MIERSARLPQPLRGGAPLASSAQRGQAGSRRPKARPHPAACIVFTMASTTQGACQAETVIGRRKRGYVQAECNPTVTLLPNGNVAHMLLGCNGLWTVLHIAEGSMLPGGDMGQYVPLLGPIGAAGVGRTQAPACSLPCLKGSPMLGANNTWHCHNGSLPL